MIVLLAGLPGTGKSTLASALATQMKAVVLNKDTIRAAAFPERYVEYSTEQDDFCIRLMLQVAGYLLERHPDLTVFLDGRVFGRAYQIEDVRSAVQRMDTPFRIIECVCREESAHLRLERDVASGTHPARNRDFSLYQRLRDNMDPVPEPKLVVDTDEPLEACSARAARYLSEAR